ncbi:sigma-70 family RNA polymerase sigma factor [Mediterraneibacter gnavus]|uniref:sigma-70 family RNA polymerase sigma factor n=1 Tax=Mediterraneibacter gnavus TaxID=33038 RepID=UPI003563F427
MLTLKELKKVVKAADVTKRIPSEKALETEEIVVKEILGAESDITVYANGYVLYRESGKTTVFPLHSCKAYEYVGVKEDRSVVNEEFFDNENWYIRLLMEATDRVEFNQTKVRSNHRIISYSDLVDDRTILVDPSSDILDQYVEKEMIRDLLGCLTVRQKEIIQLFYFEEMNQKKIADYLGIRQQSVCEMMKRALSVMKKYADAEEN